MNLIESRPLTEDYFERACKRLTGGVNSPVRSFKGLGLTPLIIKEGRGDTLIDVDGNPYIDFCSAFGALILGHSHPALVDAIQKEASLGTSFGVTTEAEIALAEKISECMPHLEQLRFVSSGTEATMTAIRLARAATRRSLIVKFSGHYHGHADPFLAQAGSALAQFGLPASAGVPPEVAALTRVLPYNDVEALNELFEREGDKIAAIILEPIAANMGLVPPKEGFLPFLRVKSRECGALIIFDEVITGFRVAKGGAAELFGMTADLTCLGKVMGGGMNVAAFGGSKKIMQRLAPQGDVFQAGTLSGNPIACRAGLAALEILSRPGAYRELEAKSALLCDPIADFIRQHKLNAVLQRQGSLFTLFFGIRKVENFEQLQTLDTSLFKTFFCFLLERGIYIAPSAFETNFVSLAHTEEHLLKTKETIIEFFNSYC